MEVCLTWSLLPVAGGNYGYPGKANFSKGFKLSWTVRSCMRKPFSANAHAQYSLSGHYRCEISLHLQKYSYSVATPNPNILNLNIALIARILQNAKVRNLILKTQCVLNFHVSGDDTALVTRSIAVQYTSLKLYMHHACRWTWTCFGWEAPPPLPPPLIAPLARKRITYFELCHQTFLVTNRIISKLDTTIVVRLHLFLSIMHV